MILRVQCWVQLVMRGNVIKYWNHRILLINIYCTIPYHEHKYGTQSWVIDVLMGFDRGFDVVLCA